MIERTTSPAVTAVIGAGVMGAGIAAIFAARGIPVDLYVRSPAGAAAAQQRVIRACESLGAGTAADRVRTVHAFEDIRWPDLGLLIESIAEDLDAKQSLFSRLEPLARTDTVFATNTSSLGIGTIGAGLRHRERLLGLHFFMPAERIPLVEVVAADATDPAIADRAATLMRQLGKIPVLVRKDMPGFLANRMQAALMREALWLIEAGVATAEDIDAAVRYSFGFRYLAAGPILQKEHSGWDTTCAVARVLYPTLNNADGPPPTLQRLVDAGHTGMKTGEGFYRWTPDTIATERRRYQAALDAALMVFRDEGPATVSSPDGPGPDPLQRV